MRPLKVYIAGPITRGDIRANVQAATDAFFSILAAGHAPLCPHWSVYANCDGVPDANPRGLTHKSWVDICLPWVEAADVVVRLAGESAGADIECNYARVNGVPVCYGLDSLFEYLEAAA